MQLLHLRSSSTCDFQNTTTSISLPKDLPNVEERVLFEERELEENSSLQRPLEKETANRPENEPRASQFQVHPGEL